jgi:hypothetical protein
MKRNSIFTIVALASILLASLVLGVLADGHCVEDSLGYLAVTYSSSSSIDVFDLDERTLNVTLTASAANGLLTTSDDGAFAILALSN